MRCEQVEEIIFAGREPDERERAEMRRHAEVCQACRVLMEKSAWLSGAREMDEDVKLPESFCRGWRRAVRSAPQGRGIGRILERLHLPQGRVARAAAYAACAVALLGAGAQMGRLDSDGNGIVTYDLAAWDGAAGRSAGDYGAPTLRMASNAETGTGMSAGTETGEKILRSATLEVTTDDLDGALASVRARVEGAGGRVTSCDVYAVGETRYAGIELSIPDGELDAFLEQAGDWGEITRARSTATDMTASYQDNALRLESAQAKKRRLDTLYAEAEDMEDIITITNALFEVQSEIDELEGANRSIDERAANARVSLQLTSEAKAAAGGEAPFLARLFGQTRKGLAQLGAFLGGVAMLAAWALPWLALGLALAALACAAYRRIKRRKM